MLKKFEERMDMRQLRKDHQAQQKRRHALIGMAILSGLFICIAAFDAVKPAEPAKSATPVVTTSPSEELSSSEQIQDEAEWSSKQEMYCLQTNQALGFQEPKLTQQIDLCLEATAGWPMEKFEK